MLKLYGSDQYLRVRNFLRLQEGTDHQPRLNWICSSPGKPACPLD
jgi:hypothetical protein